MPMQPFGSMLCWFKPCVTKEMPETDDGQVRRKETRCIRCDKCYSISSSHYGMQHYAEIVQGIRPLHTREELEESKADTLKEMKALQQYLEQIDREIASLPEGW